ENIKKIENIFYTHWHPDHTEGMRVVEEITTEWSNKHPFKLLNHGKPIKIYAPNEVIKQVINIKSPLGSYFDYFESQNFVKIYDLEFNTEKSFKNIKITPIKNNCNKKIVSTSYLIKENDKKIVYMPCDLKPFEDHDFLQDCDLFIVGSPFIESDRGIKKIPVNHPLKNELFSMNEIIDLIEKYHIKKTVIVHIEEMWGLSYDDYAELERKYLKYNIIFSYDGLIIKI
ncbi:MAG: hypothetical protein KKH52_00330, partial [Nanoarchaeota archaeon]|nr:hypothetical protein [Nanoarchaeota archaeon]